MLVARPISRSRLNAFSLLVTSWITAIVDMPHRRHDDEYDYQRDPALVRLDPVVGEQCSEASALSQERVSFQAAYQ